MTTKTIKKRYTSNDLLFKYLMGLKENTKTSIKDISIFTVLSLNEVKKLKIK